MQEPWVPSVGWEYPLVKEVATSSVFLSGKSHGQLSLADYTARIQKVGSNPGLLHFRQILYHLSHQGSPGNSLKKILKQFICSNQDQPPIHSWQLINKFLKTFKTSQIPLFSFFFLLHLSCPVSQSRFYSWQCTALFPRFPVN